MDAACEPTWLSCYEPDNEVSAVQHAYNILIDTGLEAFMAECQNAPIAAQADLEILTAAEIARRTNGYKRGEFPKTCDVLTAMIDVQGSLLYWLVAAWQPDYTGYILDYGSWPDQGRTYYTLRDARKTLKRRYRGSDDEGAIFRGLTDCIAHVCGREWRRDDGALMKIRRCLVDANWGQTSTTVNNCCRQSPHAAVLTPSYGRGIKATHKPISQWLQSRGKRVGPEWVPTETKGNQLVGLVYDTNYHKKAFHDSLGLPHGNAGSITLFTAAAATHRMFADHAAAEIPKKVEYDGRSVYEWDLKPGQDNHFFDCAVGSRVAASLCGVSRYSPKPAPRRRRNIRIT
jgi:phage terminase large subunit GpA-like protein